MSLSKLLALQSGQNQAPSSRGPEGPSDQAQAATEPTVIPADEPQAHGSVPKLMSPFAKLTGGAKPSTPVVAPTPEIKAEPVESSDDPLDLANLDMSTVGQSTSDRYAETTGFLDEIDATAPERELPEDLDHQQQGFVGLLDSIYEILTEPELFAQAVRTIMSELQSHPEYEQLVGDKDVHTLIKGMRATMGLARMRKAEKKAKTSSRAPKKSTFDLGLDLGSLGL